MNLFRTRKWLNVLLAILLPLTSGCTSGVNRWLYLGRENPEQEHYIEATMQVSYPDVTQPQLAEVEDTAPPRTITSQERDEVWDLPLEEAVQTALMNSDVIRSAGQFLSPNNQMYVNANQVPSVYDPAIQASGVLFGGVSVEAALADFDANWTNTLFFGRNETIQNSPFGGGVEGGALEVNSANFRTALNKQFAHGAQFTLSHDVMYQDTNSPNTLFASTYTGNVQAEYRQQLLAGAGPEFVRVAGPLSPVFAAIAGVGNGVLIARINQDISITNFEANIRDLVKDVEDTYWDLYLAYRNYDTAVTARNTALRTWRNAKFTQAAGGKAGFTLQDEAQSRDRYFETRAQAENELGNLYVTEQRLRNLMGIAVNDRKVIRPADTPVAARIYADWFHCLAEALTERVELRRQKWNIKSLELQLGAAKNFARPRLDFIARYRVNGFGDNLLGYQNTDQFGGNLHNMYGNMTAADQTGWDLGMEFSLPIGLRVAKTQVRNLELRLTKARKVLAAQELEISHELAVAFQELERSYATAISNYSRRQAAMDRFRIESALLEGGTGSFDMNLRAQESLATAANSYHQSLVDYNKAIVNLYFRMGTLLKQDNIHLLEGQWEPEAYKQAYARAKERANGVPAPHLQTRPPAFAADGMIPTYQFSDPAAANMSPEAVRPFHLEPEPEELPLPLPSDGLLNLPRQEMDGNMPALGLVPPVPTSESEHKPAEQLLAPSAETRGVSNESTTGAGELKLLPMPMPNQTTEKGSRSAGPQSAPFPIDLAPPGNVPPVSERNPPVSSAPPSPPAPRQGEQARGPGQTGFPAETNTWQPRQEGWGLFETPQPQGQIIPAGGWQTAPTPPDGPASPPQNQSPQTPRESRVTGQAAREIGKSLPPLGER